MTFYRFEHTELKSEKSGHYVGPFQADIIALSYRSLDAAELPPVYDDGLNFNFENDKEYVCAFTELNEVFKWFSVRDIETLESLGFRLRAYHCTDYRIGNTQAIFKAKVAQFVGEC